MGFNDLLTRCLADFKSPNHSHQVSKFYNGLVNPKHDDPRSITRTETIGFVVIALVILAVILARWGNVIPWGAR